MRAAPPRTHPFRTIALILTPEPSVLVRKAQCYGADILESPAATRTGPGSADTLDPLRITFVDQPLDLMAREAVGLVLDVAAGSDDGGAPRSIDLPTSFTIRSSTAGDPLPPT